VRSVERQAKRPDSCESNKRGNSRTSQVSSTGKSDGQTSSDVSSYENDSDSSGFFVDSPLALLEGGEHAFIHSRNSHPALDAPKSSSKSAPTRHAPTKASSVSSLKHTRFNVPPKLSPLNPTSPPGHPSSQAGKSTPTSTAVSPAHSTASSPSRLRKAISTPLEPPFTPLSSGALNKKKATLQQYLAGILCIDQTAGVHMNEM